jgi:hypothetical protein
MRQAMYGKAPVSFRSLDWPEKPNCRMRTNPLGRMCSRKRRINFVASSVRIFVFVPSA